MEIIKSKKKDLYGNPEIESLISLTLFQPSIQKIYRFINSIKQDRDFIYCSKENNKITGLLIISRLSNIDFKIKSISVDEQFRNNGIGRKLIFNFQSEFPENRILTETDGGAVNFYHRIGFKIESLGKKYHSIERYRCVLDHHDWISDSYKNAYNLLISGNILCWIAGGWALDLFHGKKTREHTDIDIVIRREDQLKLQKLFNTWEMYHTKAPGLRYWNGIDYLENIPNIWLRKNKNSPWKLEILFIDTEGENWIYKRDNRIQKQIENIGLTNKEGVTYLLPEIQLLYKGGSSKVREKDKNDLIKMLPNLTEQSRNWLRESLMIQFPEGHDWINCILKFEENI